MQFFSNLKIVISWNKKMKKGGWGYQEKYLWKNTFFKEVYK